MSNRKPHTFRPILTVLEGRDMPSVTSISLSAIGILTVKVGPGTADVSVTETSTGGITVKDSIADRTWSYAAKKVGEVVVMGGAGVGTDTFTATNDDTNPANAKFIEFIGSTASYDIIGATLTGSKVTIFTASPVPGLVVGHQVTIAGIAPAEYDGTVTVTSVVGNRFTYTVGTEDTAEGLAAPTLSDATVSGIDKFTSSGFPVSMTAGNGNDTLLAPSGNATLVGGSGQDSIQGGTGDDSLVAGSGNDYLNGGTGIATILAGVGNDTIVAMNGQASDTVETGPGTAVIWSDSVGGVTDTIIGPTTDVTIQAVTSFANGPSNILDGGTFAEPTLIPNPPLTNTPTPTYQKFTNAPLFGPSGPTVQDVTQYINATEAAAAEGAEGTGTTLDDSWLLAGLAAIAQEDPAAIERNVVYFGDGTYGVDLYGNFYRVDDELPVNIFGETYSAYASENGNMWVPIVEKAFAYYFSVYGPASYSNLLAANGGTTPYVFAAFGATEAGTGALNGALGYSSANALGAAIFDLLDQNYSTCIGLTATVAGTDAVTGAAVTLPADREFTVLGVTVSPTTGQVISVTLRDPDGANPDGVVVTLANLYASSGTLDYGNP